MKTYKQNKNKKQKIVYNQSILITSRNIKIKKNKMKFNKAKM